ncbi:MAG TPA: [protein-PII] uridylyltransferase [Burkholderiaceae bacterium]|nr:[protein-PII] uridylyltransferase [Burkholderiaceae bacterium]
MNEAVALSSPVPALREDHRAMRAAAVESFLRNRDPDRLLARLSAGTDTTLRRLWDSHGFGGELALAAVGGYGRAELFPGSDVDLLIVTDGPADDRMARRLERFIGDCWDIGLDLGHSVRSVEECVQEAGRDLTICTSVLEMRPVAGSTPLLTTLAALLARHRNPREFFQAKMLEMRQRHAKYEDTPYSLEPNTKESPGGLRDLQVIRWVAHAAGYGSTWDELAQRGLVTEDEARILQRNERILKRIRATLHVCAKRREDRLVFDLQAQAAKVLGLGGDDQRRASEELMQRYFWAAKAVTQLNNIVLQELGAALFEEPDAVPEPIDGEFQNRRGALDVIDPGLFEREPAAILRAFLTMQQHSSLQGMTARTLRAIWHARMHIDGRFRRDPANRALFMQILKQPRGITHELRRMNQWSVLGRYLPVFRRIVGRMQHDLFHVYTVDQHILMVVRNLRRFTMDEHAHEYPFCSQLMAGYDKPWLLYVAALFHDIAKGRGGDHSELGAIDARRFCKQHGMTDEDTQLVAFLVENHLTMSSVAQKQDLSDPAVIERFARQVGTEERLTTLYLLTVADIRGTSPKVWNAWKGKLLEDLYRLAKSVLTGHSAGTGERVDARRREALRILNLYGLASDSYQTFWQKLDIAYFLRNDAQDIAWHTRVLYSHASTQEPIVRTRLAPIGEGFQVVVYLRDQEDLFARICGYFDRKNLSVLDARIHTTRHGYALDSFLVVDPTQTHGYRDILSLVEAELTETLRVRRDLPPPVRGRISRRSRFFPIQPTVDLRPDERGRHYLLSVTANDRTGLLYGIARVLSQHGINLYTARVTTLGERVEDVFLIDGPSLTNPRQQLQLETDLLNELKA